MSIGDTLIFRPRGGDPARMTLPKVLPLCIDKGRVDCGDTNGTIKLWPGERLTVRCVLSDDAIIAEWMRQPLLVLTDDTQTED
jgi:hypothetical protein